MIRQATLQSPSSATPPKRGDRDVHALVAQHVQEGRRPDSESRSRAASRTFVHDGTGATRPSGRNDE